MYRGITEEYMFYDKGSQNDDEIYIVLCTIYTHVKFFVHNPYFSTRIKYIVYSSSRGCLNFFVTIKNM